ncbi:DUF5680 domain-containing protein [Paucibacter soli]|uniref:DUF5680 domain-containing protein n=1 Tax=Paucibacter soli TaxID=3133433 RepID=UPI0030A5C5FD
MAKCPAADPRRRQASNCGAVRGAAGPIYALLRQALLAAPAALPLRGPAEYGRAGLSYACEISGTLDGFEGRERIEDDAGAVVYDLRFNGSRVE